MCSVLDSSLEETYNPQLKHITPDHSEKLILLSVKRNSKNWPWDDRGRRRVILQKMQLVQSAKNQYQMPKKSKTLRI